MKKVNIAIAAMAILSALPAYAAENVDSLPKFRRSSLYTFLVRSAAQDQKLDAEVESSNLVTGLVDSFKKDKADTTETAGMKRSEVAQLEFLNTPIPTQFNDHNLDIRILDFDNVTVSEDEIKAAADAQGEKKKGGAAKFGKAALGAVTGGSGAAAVIPTDDVDYRMPAVLTKFFANQQTAPMLVGKWFGYANGKYDDQLTLIKERGLQDATEADRSAAATDKRGDAKLMDAGQELIDNTFVLAVNLRYRSNKAIIEEAQQAANLVGSAFGTYGQLASQAAGAIANATAGKGFGVQAYTYLYKLEWDKDRLDRFYAEYWDKPIEDLVASGICTLKFVGKDKASARVVASGFSKKPENELVKNAVENAIDRAIVKLQVKNEVFRTKSQIFQVSDDGKFVYAQIGTKEGVEKGDEYSILEAVEEDGKTIYKEIGKVKAVEGAIWNNEAGAEDLAAELEADGDKKAAAQLEAINLKATKFEVKKGKDLYPGLFIRLSKKK